MVNNKLNFTVTNLAASTTQRCDIAEAFKRENAYKACNHMVAYNPTAKLLLVRLNDDTNDTYPLIANGGKLTFGPEDRINFHSLEIVNTEAAEATGTVRITIGVL